MVLSPPDDDTDAARDAPGVLFVVLVRISNVSCLIGLDGGFADATVSMCGLDNVVSVIGRVGYDVGMGVDDNATVGSVCAIAESLDALRSGLIGGLAELEGEREAADDEEAS